MKKNLVVYFSRAGENYVNGNVVDLEVGNTNVAAHMIHSLIDSDIFEVKTIHEYSKVYHQCTLQAKQELENHIHPKILDYVHHFSEYDNIFVCYPNWWSTMPMAMFTFFECHDTAGKNIFPLCTHEGSGMGKSEKDIQKLCPKAHVCKGLAIRGSQVVHSKKKIEEWINNFE